MPATVNAGNWLAEVNQVFKSHAVTTLVHLNAQPEPNPISDIQPVQKHGAGNVPVPNQCHTIPTNSSGSGSKKVKKLKGW